MKIEDITIDLQATISNLNIQYGNKPGYRGPSHHIFLEVWHEEIELNSDKDIRLQNSEGSNIIVEGI